MNKTPYQILKSTASLSTMAAMMEKVGGNWSARLAEPWTPANSCQIGQIGHTLFAPTDAAFAGLTAEELARVGMLSDPPRPSSEPANEALLLEFFTYHLATRMCRPFIIIIKSAPLVTCVIGACATCCRRSQGQLRREQGGHDGQQPAGSSRRHH